MKKIYGVIATVTLIAVAGFSFYEFANKPANLLGSTKKVEFEVAPGMRNREISNRLQSEGLIRNAWAFFWLGKVTRSWGKIKAAEYEISPSMSPLQIFRLFKSGVGIQHSLLVREGSNIYQVAAEFGRQGLGDEKTILKYMRSPELIAAFGLQREGIRSLEGYLFPNTYFFDKRDDAINVMKRMVDAFLKSWTREYDMRARDIGMTRKQVVTLASIVEKETGVSTERPLVASVFWNRLRKKMRLQSDPTTIYGMWSRYDGNIRRSDLRKPSEYNTYTLPGLPVGPISNPNPESIKAVLYPAETEYLYFVSHNDGTHQFSKTYGEHNSWVKKTQVDPGAREGKSWRDQTRKK